MNFIKGLDGLVRQGWINYDLNDGSVMKRGEDYVMTDFGGCTQRVEKDGSITFLDRHMGVACLNSSWQISQLKGGFEEDKRAFEALAPTNVFAMQLSHLSWFSLEQYMLNCRKGEPNHLCAAAVDLFKVDSSTLKGEAKYHKIKRNRRTFYDLMVSDAVQSDLKGTEELKYFEILRPYISYPDAKDRKQYWEEKIAEQEPYENTWKKYKESFAELGNDVRQKMEEKAESGCQCVVM